MNDSQSSRDPQPGAPRPRASHRVGQAAFVLCLLPLLMAAFVLALTPEIDPQAPAVLWTFVGASLAWILAVTLAHSGNGHLRVVVGGAIALRLLASIAQPGLSDDGQRYVWEGELVLRGISPYAHAPAAPELEEVRRALPELYGAVGHPEVSAAYPPLTQTTHAALTGVGRVFGTSDFGPLRLMRAFYALCDLLVLWPLVRFLRRNRMPLGLCVIWAWCPLVVVEFAGSGHFDSLGILLLMGALCVLDELEGPRRRLAALRARAAAGFALLAGSILVKYLALAALPFCLRGVGWLRRLALVTLLVAAGFVPLFFLKGGFGGLTVGLSDYGLRWEWSSLTYRFVEPLFARFYEMDSSWTDPRRLGRGLMAAIWLAWALRAWLRGWGPVRAGGSLIGAFLILSPTLHPWYLAWIVPFVVLRPVPSWCWLLAAFPLTYLPQLESTTEPAWLWPVVALPFFLLTLYEARSDSVHGERRLAVAYQR